MGKYDHKTITEITKHSTFLTKEQFNDHLKSHFKKIVINLSPGSKKVFDFLAKHAIKYLGVAYLKIHTIASSLELHSSTVKRAIRQLEQLGVIKRIPQTRPKTGGDGANMYAFQPSEPAHMNLREQSKKPTVSKHNHSKNENETIYLKTTKDINTTYVDLHRLQKNYSAIPGYIPKDFVIALQRAFSDGKIIKEFWVRVLMLKRKYTISKLENIMPIALQAWEYTQVEYKRDQKEWDLDRFYKCFYGTMVQIQNKHYKNIALYSA